MNRRAHGRRTPQQGWLLVTAALLVVGISVSGSIAGAIQPPPHGPGLHPAALSSPGTRRMGSAGLGSTSGDGTAPAAGLSPFWTNITTSSGPPVPPNSASLLTYDAADHETLLLGGFYTNSLGYSYTWVFKDGAWTNITATAGSAPPPPAVGTTVMAYDASDGYVVAQSELVGTGCALAGGLCNLTWEFNSGKWTILTRQNPPVGSDPVMTYDGADGYVLLLEQTTAPLVETWSLRGGQWTQLDPGGTANGSYLEPPVSQGAGMVYDAADGYVLYFGGSGCGANGACNGTWTFSGGGWTQLQPGTAPPGRDGGSLVYDTADGYVLLFGGRNDSLGTAGVFDYNDTWTYEAGQWAELTTAAAPGPRSYAAIVFDQADGLTVLFGGFHDSPRSSPGTDSTWLWSADPPIVNVTVAASPLDTDPGVPVSFSSQVVGGFAPLSYSWKFGDGSTSSLPDPSHSFSRPGSYTVTLNVSDSAGKSAAASLQVSVGQDLTTSIRVAPDPTDAGLATNFSLQSVGGTPPFTYSWVFGDGGRGTSATESHTYVLSGTYGVEAWENDSVGNSSFATASLLVNPPLQLLALNATPNPMQVDEPVNFNASVTGGSLPYTYAWTFGDGSTGGNVSATSHTYATGGPFQVNLTVVDAAGVRLTASVEVSVSLVVNVSADASLGAPPVKTSFTSEVAGGAPGYTYSWQFGDGGTSAVADPVYYYETPGNYTASLVVTDSLGDSASADWPITIVPAGANFTAQLVASRTSLAVNQVTNVTLTASGGAGKYTVTWPSVPAGCVQTSLLDLSCTPTQAGTYTPTAQVTDTIGDLAVASVSYTVAGLVYPVTFNESGLPTGVEWYVNVSGQPSLSNLTTPTGGNGVGVLLTNGTYPFAVSSDDKRWAAAYVAEFTVNGGPTTVSIVFHLVTFPVSFYETGLPAGLTWSVTFNSVVGILTTDGATDVLTFAGEANGSYPYQVAPVPQWVQDTVPASGTETVNGSAVVVLLAYTPPLYAVTFEETGLPSGAAWSVTLNGTTFTSTTDAMVFLAQNGTASYSVGSVGNWTPSPGQGTVAVLGDPVVVTVDFVFTYLLSFGRPNGTPNGTVWSVSVSGPSVLSTAVGPDATVSLSGTGPSLRFSEPNGTYFYTVGVPDYPNYSFTGNQTISGATAIVIPPPLPSSSPGGGGGGGSPSVTSVPAYLIYEAVAAVAVILLTAALLGRRRRAPRAPPARPTTPASRASGNGPVGSATSSEGPPGPRDREPRGD